MWASEHGVESSLNIYLGEVPDLHKHVVEVSAALHDSSILQQE